MGKLSDAIANHILEWHYNMCNFPLNPAARRPGPERAFGWALYDALAPLHGEPTLVDSEPGATGAQYALCWPHQSL